MEKVALTQLERRILTCIRQYIDSHRVSPTIAEVADALSIRSRGTVHRYVQSLIEKGRLERHGTGWRGLRLAAIAADDIAADDTAADNMAADDCPELGVSEAGIHETGIHETRLHETRLHETRLHDTAVHGIDDISPNTPYLTIPLLGRIAAGMPIEAIPDENHLDLAAFFIGPDRYALRVSGESMIDAGILDGDTVIIRKQSTASTGDIVVALIDSQEATLKRLGEYSKQVVELIAENQLIPKMRYSASRVAIQGVLIGQLRSY